MRRWAERRQDAAAVGLMQEMGEENVFCASGLLLESTQQALRRARELQRQAEGSSKPQTEKG